MAVGALVVELLQRIKAGPEVGTVLGRQLIQGQGYVGVLQFAQVDLVVIGVNQVAQLPGGEQYLQLGLRLAGQGNPGQLGDGLGNPVRSPGMAVPLLGAAGGQGEGDRFGLGLPGGGRRRRFGFAGRWGSRGSGNGTLSWQVLLSQPGPIAWSRWLFPVYPDGGPIRMEYFDRFREKRDMRWKGRKIAPQRRGGEALTAAHRP